MLDLGHGLRIFDGPPVRAALGFHYPTRMAVIELGQGRLAIWSPVKAHPDLRDILASLGQVTHLVLPNHLHHLWAADWLALYPDAVVLAAPGLAAKRADLPIRELGDHLPEPLADKLDMVVMTGNLITTEVVLLHRASRTVLFADLLQNLPRGWFSGWRAVVAKADLMLEPRPSVPRKFRLAFTDRVALRPLVQRLKDWQPERIIPAHGSPVLSGGSALLDEAFAWLTPRR